MATLFSGLTIEAATGRGFVLLSLPIIVFVCLLHLSNPFTYIHYVPSRVIGALLFVTVALVTGSRPETIALILSALIFFDALEANKIKMSDDRLRKMEKVLAGVLVLMLLGAFSDIHIVFLGNEYSLWSETMDGLGVPRLKLFFSEPSYLGSVAVGMLFVVQDRRLRWLLGTIAILSQSAYALAYLLFILLRNRPAELISISTVVALYLFFKVYWSNDEFFFENSGFVRLIGIIGLEDIAGLHWLFGYGLGAGDEAIAPVFDIRGVFVANGFLFSLIYDLGLFGVLGLYLVYKRQWFDILHLSFLLLNFGAGSFLIPLLMHVVRTSKNINLKNLISLPNRIHGPNC